MNDSLTGVRFGICIGFSAITFVISFILKLIPLEILIDKWIKSKIEKEEVIKSKIVKFFVLELNLRNLKSHSF